MGWVDCRHPDREDLDGLAARQRVVVARLRTLMADQADRLDDLVDDGVRHIPRLGPAERPEFADTLASAALVAQAARDFATERIDQVEYQRRLDDAMALLPADR